MEIGTYQKALKLLDEPNRIFVQIITEDDEMILECTNLGQMIELMLLAGLEREKNEISSKEVVKVSS